MKVGQRVFAEEFVRKSMLPNTSPVVETRTFRDELTGSEIDFTVHENGSITVIAERIKRDAR